MNDIVKYNNDMNLLNFKGMTKVQLDLFMNICAKVKSRGTEEVIIDIKELKKSSHFTQGGNRNIGDELDIMTDKLQAMRIKKRECNDFLKFVLFPTFQYIESEDVLKVRVNEDLVWLLNEFDNYTSFELEEFVGLKSKYSKNLYRLLKQWRTVGKYTFNNIEQFKILMDIPMSYSNKTMVNKCVNVAVKEIKDLEKSFKGFDYKLEYGRSRGCPLKKIHFSWQAEEVRKIPVENDNKENIVEKIHKPKTKNRFNDFKQRTYDYEKLEKELFANFKDE